jgi:hypothetical protein
VKRTCVYSLGRTRDQVHRAALGLVTAALLGSSLACAGTADDAPAAPRLNRSDQRNTGAAYSIWKDASKPRAVLPAMALAALGGGTLPRKSGEVCRPALRPAAARSWLVEVGRQETRPACPSIGSELGKTQEPSVVDEYLCGVYWRMPNKIDDAGDFTWKDAAAAARVGRTVCEYAIQGMHRDLREALYALGTQADAAGLNWSFLSAFRDDFRQTIATGFKAQPCQSLHGGSCRTEGWGDGQAADLWLADESGKPARDATALMDLVDRVGPSLGLSRPLRGADPPHVQVKGEWKAIAEQLRAKRLGVVSASVNDENETVPAP